MSRYNSVEDYAAEGLLGLLFGVVGIAAAGTIGLALYNIVLLEALALGIVAGAAAFFLASFPVETAVCIGVGAAVLCYLLFRSKVGFWVLVTVLMISGGQSGIATAQSVLANGNHIVVAVLCGIARTIIADGIILFLHLTARERMLMNRKKTAEQAAN